MHVVSQLAPFRLSPSEVLKALETDPELGLSTAQVLVRRNAQGWNQLDEAPGDPVWLRVARQFRESVVLILISAGVIACLVGDWFDGIPIFAIVVLNGLISFFQEERAAQALESLRKLSIPMAHVFRDGRRHKVPAQELVVGDLIVVEGGDQVPADARLIDSMTLHVQEAALTGESVAVEKQAFGVLPDATPLAERHNMIYQGTLVTSGRATAVVTAIGMSTELGQIASLLKKVGSEQTPLQARLARLGRALLGTCLALVAVILATRLWQGGLIAEVLLFSVSLAVAAVPEGLPAVVTIALALGVRRMVARHALVRRLSSVETLGAVTVICTDKTGTLTKNEMTVRDVLVADRQYQVTGTGYSSQGVFVLRGKVEHSDRCHSASLPLTTANDAELQKMLMIFSRCHHASSQVKDGEPGRFEIVGDPTEGALVIAAMKGGMELHGAGACVQEIPFDSDRKLMSVVIDCGGRRTMLTKGAPEIVLSRCLAEQIDGMVRTLTESRRQLWWRRVEHLASQGRRVLAFAYRELTPVPVDTLAEQELNFLGIAGLIDPPRENVRAAVATCHRAGIKPLMITGDHPTTARAIGVELGLLDHHGQVLCGDALGQMTDAELVDVMGRVSIIARATAEQKLRVVDALRKAGHIVAMTGDGVNDAPAVKAADVGIAMGVNGTDVTRHAADLVLTDDNFASIVDAVEEGRGIYDNIRKVVHYLLSCNIGEVMFVFGATIAGWPTPLRAAQLLWINLLTDGLPAIALAMEPTEQQMMKQLPRPTHEPVIPWRQGLTILWHGALIAAVAAWGFAWSYQNDATRVEQARATAFCVLAYSQLLYSLSCRSWQLTFWQKGFRGNRALVVAVGASAILQTAFVIVTQVVSAGPTLVLPLATWWYIIGLSLIPVSAIELIKLIRSRRGSLHIRE